MLLMSLGNSESSTHGVICIYVSPSLSYVTHERVIHQTKYGVDNAEPLMGGDESWPDAVEDQSRRLSNAW